MVFLTSFGKVLPAGWERWSCRSTQYWWGHAWSAESSSGHTSARETWTYWEESNTGPPRCWRAWSTSPVRRGWERWGCSAWGREGSGEYLFSVHNYLKGGCRENRARLLSVVPRARQDKKTRPWICLNIRKHFFAVQAMEPWHGLSETLWSLPGDFWKVLDLGRGTLSGCLGWAEDGSRGSFQPQTFCDSSPGVFLWHTNHRYFTLCFSCQHKVACHGYRSGRDKMKARNYECKHILPFNLFVTNDWLVIITHSHFK